MILDNASSHVVSIAKVGKSRGFSTLELSNMTLVILPRNVTRHNSIFQNSIQEESLAMGFVTIRQCYIEGLKKDDAQHQTSYYVES